MRISAFVLPAGWGISHFYVRENWGEEMSRAKHVLVPPAIFILEYTRWTITRR